MDLYDLFYGKSKSRMKLIKTDSFRKCSNYMEALKSSGSKGFFEIKRAEPGAKTWQRKSATIGGNKQDAVPRISKNGRTKKNGWIGKNGFNEHT